MEIVEWVKLWEAAREDKRFDFEKVLSIWNENPAKFCRIAKSWEKMELGYRRKSINLNGEKYYEEGLLKKVNIVLINPHDIRSMKLTIKHNAWPLANKKRGQTITDCMGIISDNRRRSHPIAIEIKKDANNPWFAVVETLQQIRLMRAGVRELEKYFTEKIAVASIKGAWGIVLAPEKYYQKNEKSYKAACELCDFMAKHSQARIIIASISPGFNNLTYKAGYWPQ